MLLFNFILLPFFHKLDIFQYILCCYSTTSSVMFDHSDDLISIHHMLLFNCLHHAFALLQCDFNTSHVVIQPTKNHHSCILLISINHDFNPFLSYFTNHSIENQLLVRNHVFTPFDRLFQKITW